MLQLQLHCTGKWIALLYHSPPKAHHTPKPKVASPCDRALTSKRKARIVHCSARRRVRYDEDKEEDEEYGYNEEIAMLEMYSQSARGEALLVRATVDTQEELVLVFKRNIPVGGGGGKRERAAAWMRKLVEADFSIGCDEHEAPRNDLTRFCIDCKLPICLKCVTSRHYNHKLIKIYRNSKKEAIPLDELQHLIDCSGIQVYRCNMQAVVSIEPLANGKTNNLQPPCKVCQRRLIDPLLFNYCSFSCKVKAFEDKSDDSQPPYLLLQPEEPPKKRHRRKGIPHRSPSH